MTQNQQIESLGWTEVDALNFLQDKRAISDNCIRAEDIAEANWERALEMLTVNKPQ